MDERTRILLCEDDESLGMLLREYLQQKVSVPTSSPTARADTKPFSKANTTFASLT